MHNYNHPITTCQSPDGKEVYQVIPDRNEPDNTGIDVPHCSATFMNINAKFAKPPLRPENAHVPLHNRTDLADIICYETPLVVSNDYVVSYTRRLLYQHTELAYVELRTPPHQEALAPCSV